MDGPAHEVVAAFVIGASSIRRTRAPASLLRLFDMLVRILVEIMNELVVLHELAKNCMN